MLECNLLVLVKSFGVIGPFSPGHLHSVLQLAVTSLQFLHFGLDLFCEAFDFVILLQEIRYWSVEIPVGCHWVCRRFGIAVNIYKRGYFFFRPLRPVTSQHHVCTWSVAKSYGYAKKWIVGKSALEPRENACTQGPGAHLSARPCTRAPVRARIPAWLLEKNVCSH